MRCKKLQVYLKKIQGDEKARVDKKFAIIVLKIS